MKKIFIIPFFLFALGGVSSCRKYVEIDQVGRRVLKYTDDYQNLLNNGGLVESSYVYPIWASDDIYSDNEEYLSRMTDKLANSYRWSEYIVGDDEDEDWSNMYKQMYIFNQIIQEIEQSEGGTPLQKRHVMAQAKLHRAMNYFYLVNIYAKQYNAATASQDPGVPLLLSNNLFVELTRKPVQAVYEQIISDIKSATEDLPIKAKYNVLASQGAAKGLLARVYLQMGNYAEALKYAEQTLAIQHDLQDLNDFIKDPNQYPNPVFDTEEIWLKAVSGYMPPLSLNPSLLALFEPTDLRYQLFVVDGEEFESWNAFVGKGYNKVRIISTNGKITNGPNVPEMMLIKAEALARDPQRYKEAISVLNALRKYRFKPEDYADLPVTNAGDALVAVIKERRKELMAKGLRWFDQKRLMDDPRFVAPVQRTFKGGSYILNPQSNRYVFPIASKYIHLNPEIVQNPR